MLHSKDESYTELRAAAIRFEAQQRLFTELGASMTGSGRGHGVFQVQGDVPKRKVKTLKIFMLKQLGKVVLRSAIDAGRQGTCRKTALQI